MGERNWNRGEWRESIGVIEEDDSLGGVGHRLAERDEATPRDYIDESVTSFSSRIVILLRLCPLLWLSYSRPAVGRTVQSRGYLNNLLFLMFSIDRLIGHRREQIRRVIIFLFVFISPEISVLQLRLIGSDHDCPVCKSKL